MSKLSVIYYSATGHGTAMARRVADAAEGAGAEVRVRHVAETRDPESFAQNPAWTANYEATKDLPAAAGDDIVWADAVIFGSPTRFGSPSSQFRTFIDSLGGLWSQGKLADKVYAGFTSSADRSRRPGDHTARPLHHADAFRRHHCAARIHRRPEVRRWQPIRGQPHHRAGQSERDRRRHRRRAGPPGPPRGHRRRPPHVPVISATATR